VIAPHPSTRHFRWVAVVLLIMTACDGGTPASSVAPGSASTPARPSASASQSQREIRGCVPECSTGFSDPGSIGPGLYTTAHFLDGHLTVRYPTPWVSHEDQGVEFSAEPPERGDMGRVLFWDDIIPWVADTHYPAGHAVGGVPNTVAGWMDWLHSNPALEVSVPHSATIGEMGLPAMFVDIAIADQAANQAPYCRKLDLICVVLLSWPNAGGNTYVFGKPSVLRLYLSDITYGGASHLLAVAVEGTDAMDLKSFLPLANRVIASADAPIEAT
jgi:hypothetical protein